MEVHSRRVLYENHAEIRLPMASTTKILTAITVLNKQADLDAVVTIPAQAEGVEGSSVYLKSGEKYSIKDLLYGLMLRSGNDCATALALYQSGSIADFAAEMNENAQKAGALSSNFKNPHGLPCEGHYTTAKDLALITCYAMENPTFCEIVATKYYEPLHWTNKNKLLSLYEGGIGVKTGYTKQAGRCLVSAAKRKNMRIVSVLLNCPTTYERTISLFDDAFSAFEYTTIVKKGEKFSTKIDGKEFTAYAKEEFAYPIWKEELNQLEIRTNFDNVKVKKSKKDEIIGQFEIYLSKRLLFSGNLYKL